MKDRIQDIAEMIVAGADAKLVQTMMLDVLAEQAAKIVELEKKAKRHDESLSLLASGAKPVNSGSFGGGGGFSIG